LVHVVTSDGEAYQLTTLALNPGLDTLPWLSNGIAKGFSQYKVHRWDIEYVPSVGTTTDGNVLIAPDYELNDTPPANETTLASYVGAAEAAAYAAFKVYTNPKAGMAEGIYKLVRHEAIQSLWTSVTAQLYEYCNLHIATVGVAAGVNPGRIYVNYDIEFFSPSESLPQASSNLTTASYLAPNVVTARALGLQDLFESDLTAPFGGQYVVPGVSVNLDNVGGFRGDTTLQPGVYKITMYVPLVASFVAVAACQAECLCTASWFVGGIPFSKSIALASFCDYNTGTPCYMSHQGIAQFEFSVLEDTPGGEIVIHWELNVTVLNMTGGNSFSIGTANQFQHLMVIDRIADNLDTQAPITPLMLASRPHNGVVKYRSTGEYPCYPSELQRSCTIGAAEDTTNRSCKK
jgi:hypothetical protein